jgi:hypothetical protein
LLGLVGCVEDRYFAELVLHHSDALVVGVVHLCYQWDLALWLFVADIAIWTDVRELVESVLDCRWSLVVNKSLETRNHTEILDE